ncbi:MAG TPA: gliding motility-associated C-terminal domain-containing protein [Puia sp.]|nr:gliding motility-associated C-terminal domain-containing protein [Puia sp.]
MTKFALLILSATLLLSPPCARAQSPAFPCDNWLYLPSTPYSSIQLGDLDISGTQITVEAEFCRTTPYSGGPLYAGDLVSKHEDPNTVNYLLRPNDAEITTSDGYFQTPPVCDIALNITYHVAMTYDGATLKFYRNGVLLSQIAATGTLFQQDIPTEIGMCFYQTHPTNFVGYINEVRIWNVVRTQAQILAYMNTALPNPTAQPGLLAYYNFAGLSNLQGNSTWNGNTVGAPVIGQTNPFCSAVIQAAASFSLTTSLPQQTICEGGPFTLYGYFSGGITSPNYTWQVSQDSGKTWTDLPYSNSLREDVTAPMEDKPTDLYYRLAVPDGANPSPSSCAILSAPVILTVEPGLDADFSFAQDVCNPLQVAFTGPSGNGVTYTWTIGGTSYASPAVGTASLAYTFPSYGTYPVTLTTSGTACSGSSSKSIVIKVDPADLISTKDTLVCAGKPVPLHTLPSLDFCWSPSAFLDDPASANPVANPAVTTKYYFTAKTTGNNLVVNGDFSGGNTAFTSAYVYADPNTSEGQYTVGTNASRWNGGMSACGDHTTGSGNMLIVNGAPDAGVNVWNSQTMNVAPNTNYAFSVWVMSEFQVNPASLQFSINGVALGDPVSPAINTCTWSHFYTTWNSGTNTTATISLVNDNTIREGNDFAVDDISFAPVLLETDSVTITVDRPFITAGPADTTVCSGMPVPLHAGGSATSYSWSPAADLSDASSADPVALLSAADTPVVYIVTGTSFNRCTDTASVHVHLYPASATISPDTLICRGDPARLIAGGGSGYRWSPSSGLDNPVIPDPVARPATTTRYTVSLTDGYQCIEKDSVTIHVKTVPVFTAPPDESICSGFSVPLKSVNPTGYIYGWSPSSGLDDPSAPVPIAAPVTDMTYTLHIADSLCSAYDSSFSVAVTVLPIPVIAAEKENDIDCAVHMASLNATGGVSYVWSPSAGLSDPFSATPVASVDSTTTYVVKGTAANGCYAYDTLTVSVTATGANTFVVPNAFTPNGDGHNDCFGVLRWGDVRLEEMDIFNRMGQRVFTTHSASDCWDGTYKGQPQPEGGYVYVIRAHTFCGEVTRTGMVMLIR